MYLCIAQTLHENKQCKYIETVYGRGYRLLYLL